MAESGTSRDQKRETAIAWDEYFMDVAYVSAHRSKDPNTQVGACVVNKENRIVGVGYNGMPDGVKDDEMHWGKNDEDPLKNKYPYVCHAEMNAILNRSDARLRGCTMYTTLYPCSECAKMIIQSGITKVVYLSDQDDISAKAAKILFDKKNEKEDGKIEIVKYTPDSKDEIEINFMRMAKVGACVVNKENRIVGIGFNGMPDGVKDDEMPGEKKELYVCHAEMNAILNSYDAPLRGYTMYTTLYPCTECAKLIIQSGITSVVYLGNKNSEKTSTKDTKFLFDEKNIEIVEYVKRYNIKFDLKRMAKTGRV